MIPGAFANLPLVWVLGVSGCRVGEARVQDTEERARRSNNPVWGGRYRDNFGYFSWLSCTFPPITHFSANQSLMGRGGIADSSHSRCSASAASS